MYSLWLARNYLKSDFIFLHGDLIFSFKMLYKFINFPYKNSVLVDEREPKDWDDAMKIISSNYLLKYMSKSISLNEMDGVAIGMYKFNNQGSSILFKTIGNVCLFIVVSLGFNWAYYLLYPKTTYMLNHLTSSDQVKAWLAIYREMKFRSYSGLILGVLGYLLIAYGWCK